MAKRISVARRGNSIEPGMTGHDGLRGPHDPVTRYLAERGVSTTVLGTGLLGLVANWDAIASRAERYDLTLDDWLNDLDLRDIIAGAMSVAPEHDRHAVQSILGVADDRFRRATIEAPRPLVADTDRVAQWWYLRCPAHPGASMRDDLLAAGLLART